MRYARVSLACALAIPTLGAVTAEAIELQL